MRLKHIYITKEGEPMANPEMEYPTEPIEDDDGELILNDSCPNCHTEYDAIDAEYQICHLCKFDSSHEAELQRYHSGLLPFEDAKQVKLILASTRFTFPVWLANILPIDLEVEVVEIRTLNGKPCGDGPIIPNEGDCLDFTKFLRIKP